MVAININFPQKQLGIIVEKTAFAKREAIADEVKEEFDHMAQSLYDKANGGVVNKVSGKFAGSFFRTDIDTKNKLGMIIGFDPSKCSYIHFILGGTIYMPPRDIVEMTKQEFDIPNNIKRIIGDVNE